LVVEDGGLEDGGAEAEELVIGVSRGGVAALGGGGIVEEGLEDAAGLVGEGILEGSGEGIGDLVGGGEGDGGEAARGGVSAARSVFCLLSSA
jgi:hypothetical protein